MAKYLTVHMTSGGQGRDARPGQGGDEVGGERVTFPPAWFPGSDAISARV